MDVGNNIAKSGVLIVDDDDLIRKTVCEMLALEGICSLSAAGAQECLHILRSGFRGVILMDVMMPGKDGWDVIREMEQEGLLAGNIISMLTALDVPDERMNGLQEVVVDYIVKPFEPESFVNTVRGYLMMLDTVSGLR